MPNVSLYRPIVVCLPIGPSNHSCKTSNDVRCRDVGSEESTREEVGCGGNEDVKMDEWSHQDGQN